RRPPSGVAWTERAPRKSSGMPNISSRLLMCRLMAPCVTDNSSAAAVMLERRTVASSARSAFRDGRFAPKAVSLAAVVSFFHSSIATACVRALQAVVRFDAVGKALSVELCDRAEFNRQGSDAFLKLGLNQVQGSQGRACLRYNSPCCPQSTRFPRRARH